MNNWGKFDSRWFQCTSKSKVDNTPLEYLPHVYVVLRLEVSESSGDTGEANVDDTSYDNEVSEDADQADQDVVISQKILQN